MRISEFLALSISEKEVLTDLTFSSNRLSELSVIQWQVLRESISECKNLEHLKIMQNDLPNQTLPQWTAFVALLADCESLTSLDLSDSDIHGLSDSKWSILENSFSHLSNLTTLNIGGSKLDLLTEKQWSFVQQIVTRCPNLSVLDLSNSRLDRMLPDQWQSLGTVLSLCSVLKTLRIEGNNISLSEKPLVHCFAQALKQCPSLMIVEYSLSEPALTVAKLISSDEIVSSPVSTTMSTTLPGWYLDPSDYIDGRTIKNTIAGSAETVTLQYNLILLATTQIKQVKCCKLYYDAITTNPTCYIHLRGSTMSVVELLDTIISSVGAELVLSITVDRQSNPWFGYNREFATLTEVIWGSLDWTGVETTSIQDYCNLISMHDKSDTVVMWGPYYDHTSKHWTSQLAVWICFGDPVMRSFLVSISESRATLHLARPINYWTARIHELAALTESTAAQQLNWQNTAGKQAQVGTDFYLAVGTDGFQRGTLGPSLRSLIPLNTKLQQHWYLASSHVFQVDGNFVPIGTKILSSERTEIGSLVAICELLHLAVVAVWNAAPTIKVSSSEHVRVIAVMSSDGCEVTMWKGWNEPVYKSGASTALTMGKTYSWGGQRNPAATGEIYHTQNPGYVVVRRDDTSIEQVHGFSEAGDSGAPVFLLESQSTVNLVGLVKARCGLYPEWKFTLVQPLLMNVMSYWLEEHMLEIVEASKRSRQEWCSIS